MVRPTFRACCSAVNAWIRDVPRFRRALRRPGDEYLRLCNRGEQLEATPEASGFRCLWQWTSELRPARILPSLGLDLMRRALDENPIDFAESPTSAAGIAPQVSFLIGHRGAARLPQLLTTLKSIAAQRDATVECIVIEQESHSLLANHLPAWVKHVHTPPPTSDMPYCRSWAFNVGARHARGRVLVLHDNDMLVPANYAAQILDRVQRGYDAVNLKRFIFYLTQAHTSSLATADGKLLDKPPESVVQNLEGGGSVAITAESFMRIGGMDESFIGWGGEDNELWERAATLRVWPWANLPIVHLWHAPQTEKDVAHQARLQKFVELSRIEPTERIERLLNAPQGSEAGPYIHGGKAS